MFGLAGETQFDLRFRMFGIPIRVHPMFWALSVMLGWHPFRFDLVLLWALCVFISILVHELGHAIAARRFGYCSEIVLYAMGGYATTGRFSTWRTVTVAAAGPAAGFALGGLTWVIARSLPQIETMNDFIDLGIGWLIYINIFWTCINLVPCLPLDGGRIMEALVHRYLPRQATKRVLQVSIFFSGAVAAGVFYLVRDFNFLILMFGIICAQSVMAYKSMFDR